MLSMLSIVKNWKLGLGILCIYGFFIELKPSEPYLTPYLVEDKGFTNNEVSNLIYPYWTYGQLQVIFFVPMIAKIISTKSLFYLETLGFLITRVLLIWGNSLFQMQIMQLTYAIGTSVKAIYWSYVYLIFDSKHYQCATSYIWAANALGRCLSGILGQILIDCNVSYLYLNYFSMASVTIALFFALLIPKEQYRNTNDVCESESCLAGYVDESTALKEMNAQAYDKLIRVPLKQIDDINNKSWWKVVADEYTMVLFLFRDKRGPMAFTWILTRCCEELVGNYHANLWYNISDDSYFYGSVVALHQGLGVCAALFPVALTYSIQDNESLQDMILHCAQQVASLGLFASLLIMTFTDKLSIAYLTYITYGMCYFIFITSISCSMAASSSPHEQVLLFATSMFFADGIETIITAFLSSGNGSSTTTWFTVITFVQGLTVPVYFYESYRAGKVDANPNLQL